MPRAPKKTAIIPTTSMVASAVRYDGKAARIFRPNQNWQTECYRHYAICGEARFAARFFGHALSRATLGVAKKSSTGPEPQTSGPAYEGLEAMFNGKDGQAQMLEALGIHLTVAGECYVVGRTVEVEDPDSGDIVGQEVWEVVSVLEMSVQGEQWTIKYGNGVKDVLLTDDDVVIRVWIPNPGKRIEADSPFRSLLPILTEIEWLTRHIFAQVQSRLAGAGILFLDQDMTFPEPPPVDGVPQDFANKAEGLMRVLADNMVRPINDPSSPAALVPIIVTAPGETIDKATLMHFWSNLDEKALEMRTEAIRRFALGMELPPEQILGMGSNGGTGGGSSNGVSHWGAWQIEESTIKMFVEPMLELVCNALTIGYIRPLTQDIADYVTSDTASLRLRPDRSKEAMELYDRGVLSPVALFREIGFDVTDMPTDEEFQRWLLMKVASGSATPEMVAIAAKALGVDVGVPVSSAPAPSLPNETPPPPSLEEHPTRPRDPGENAALLAASDALVYRALERAGNRIRQEMGVKPPGVKSYAMHTLHPVNGSADKMLDDAWSCAPQVLDGITDVETHVQLLNSYVRSLFATQSPHSRDRLKQWLEVSS